MGKLFGTDGIRGVANEYPITSEMAVFVGKAVATFFNSSPEKKGKIVIGKDTRLSGDMLCAALAAGISAVGADAIQLGTIPTPAVALLTRTQKADGGIVVSASHNPYFDNGIKVFGPDGCKLSDAEEAELESILIEKDWQALCSNIRDVGKNKSYDNATDEYVSYLLNSVPNNFSLNGMNIVLDCANGATYKAALKLYESLGADIQALFIRPDGKNINDQCGSQHPEVVAKTILETKANIGLAFDGDGDRLIAVDEKGEVLTGDQIIAVCANHMKIQGTLKNNAVVTTIMSNLGFKISLESLGIKHFASDVGDRHVFQMMKKEGAVLGGEDSGHMIFLNHHTTGDGLLSSLQLLLALKDASEPLSELKKVMTVYPQELINVEVSSKPEIKDVAPIKNTIDEVETELGDKGRVLVRYSGTQPVCRVMVEGPTKEKTMACCEKIAHAVNDAIGVD